MKQNKEIKIEYLLKKARLADSKTIIDQRFANKLKERLLEEFLNKKPKNNNLFTIFNFMKNRPKIIALSAFLTVLITSVVGMTLYYKSIAKKSTNENQIVSGAQIATLSANINKVSGDVRIKAVGADESAVWEKVEEGLEINSLFSVKTGSDSKAVLEVADGSSIRLNENTEIILAKLNPDEIIVDQVKGEAYHRVAKNPAREYKVISSANLKNFNAIALGTAFNTTVNQDANLNIKCVESKISVNFDEEKPAELLTEGQEVNINLLDTTEIKLGNIDGETLDNNWFKFNIELDQANNSVLGVFADNQSPDLEILEPGNGYKTEHSEVMIRGSVSPSALLKFKNGDSWEIVNNNDGNFETIVALNLGENNFEFKAYNPSGANTAAGLNIVKVEAPKPVTAQQVENPAPAQTPDPVSPAEDGIFHISSIRSPEPGKVDISWKFEGFEERTGWKVVFSKNSNPEYPSRNKEDYFQYIDIPSSRNAVISNSALNDGGEFHFRVCRYSNTADAVKCDIYTPDIAITVQSKPAVEVIEPPAIPVQSESEIYLKKTGNGDSIGLIWEPSPDLDISKGYKLVWDKVHNPTYPKNAESTEYWGYVAILPEYKHNYISPIPIPEGFLSGTWYVRICRYLGNQVCDVYSNEVRVEF